MARIEPDDAGLSRRTVGGALDDRGLPHLFRYRPFEVDHRHGVVTVHPPFELAPATWYRIEIDGRATEWAFRTRPALPAVLDQLRVAADGTADFCTVQGAIDAAPTGLDRPVIITVAAGHYRELCFIAEHRPPMIIRGAGRGRTVISYANNNRLNGVASDSRCRLRRLGDRDLYNGWRANVGVDAADVSFEDLTMINTTGPGGSQAEAFRGNHERLLLNRVELIGHQDTVRVQGRAFLTECRISGTVDFVWGTGAVYHWRNEFRSRAAGYVFQVRNGADERGHVLRDCRFSREGAVVDRSVWIARTDTSAFPHSEVSLIDCTLDRHIAPSGYLITGDGPATAVRFAETGSRAPDGSRVDLSLRTAAMRRPDRRRTAADADPATVLDGWVPRTVNAGETAVEPGAQVVINWSAPPGHSPDDLIMIGEHGVSVESSATLGAVVVTAPRRPGRHPVSFRPVGGDSRSGATATIEVIDK
ncbi:pectinesterase family protein [Microlunatus elymi]|uniref:pectinesterase family protein n=1 Tax=Microlunatus elymi TaxID=2596828 RepID=UPI00143D3C08|nr:pectinesterase family protein [Microlunatus elymi]